MPFSRLKVVPQPAADDLTAYWFRRETEGRSFDDGLLRGFSDATMRQLIVQGIPRELVYEVIDAKVREYTLECEFSRPREMRGRLH